MEDRRPLEAAVRDCAADISALEEVYVRLKREVYAVGYSILRDPGLSEDCVQETFVRLPRAARKFRGESGGRPFVLAIARRAALELYRKNRRTLTVGWDEVEPAEAAGDEGGAYVEHLLSFLDSGQRQAFTLHVYGDLTFQETAAVLRCPVSTAKSRYQRACDIIRKRVEREESV